MPQPGRQRMLDPALLARLGTLELVARTVVDGLLTGLHRSPHFGFSQEFAEYRAYNEGDDLRFVDWNVYARTDRAYVKRFRGETNTAVTVLLDASASMRFGAGVSKLDQARYLAAALAYLARRQHDAIGLVTFDEKIRDTYPPAARPESLMRVYAMLEHLDAGKGTDLLASLQALGPRLQKRGLVVLISDLYADPEALYTALQPMSHAGHDLAVFQVLDPDELEPDVGTISSLRDLETNEAVVVAPEYMSTQYRRAIADHCEALESICRKLGADYSRLLTTDALDTAIMAYLGFRERSAR